MGLKDCIGCGSCSYVCPAHIPLVHYFNYAKGELAALEKAKLRTEATRKQGADLFVSLHFNSARLRTV